LSGARPARATVIPIHAKKTIPMSTRPPMKAYCSTSAYSASRNIDETMWPPMTMAIGMPKKRPIFSNWTGARAPAMRLRSVSRARR
jgi:hypothetical protein